MPIVRELITVISFRVNTAGIRRAENVVRQASMNLANIGRNMTLGVTIPLGLMSKSFIEAAMDVEVLDQSLIAFLGTAEKAKRFKESIFAFAKESPLLTVEEIGRQSQRLLGIGIPSEEVIPVLRTLGNIASVTQRPLQRLVKAYVDVRQTGKLQGQEIRQFAQNSVGIIQLLSNVLGKSTAEVDAMQKRGAISFKMVEAALESMGGQGSKAALVIEKIAAATKGRLLKLMDTWFLFRAEIGKRVLPLIIKFIDAMADLMDKIRKLDDDFKRFGLIVVAVLALTGPVLLLIKFLALLAGPLGILLLILGAISLIIDDFVVWQRKGHSIFGKIFGDYDEFKARFINTFKTLKMWITEIIPGAFIAMKEGIASTFNSIIDTIKNFVNRVISMFEKVANSPFVKPWIDITGKTASAVTESAKSWTPIIKKGVEKTSEGIGTGASAAARSASFWTNLLKTKGGAFTKKFVLPYTETLGLTSPGEFDPKVRGAGAGGAVINNTVNVNNPIVDSQARADALHNEFKSILDKRFSSEAAEINVNYPRKQP